MAQPGPAAPNDEEVFAPTERGNRELKSSDTALSAEELQVLVLVDGFSKLGEIVGRVPGTPHEEISAAVRKLIAGKFIVSTAGSEPDAMGSGFSTIAVPAGFFSGLTMDSSPEAEGGTSILKKKGYFVRIARRAPPRQESRTDWHPTVLVVDDDPDLQKLIRTYLSLEGFSVRAALKRDDILVALRQQPAPDLILLDVQLPDANGFDILQRMRHHPVLKTMPVIMLTAEATRESVLRGLQGGADGYVTKPFEPDLLITAVKAVLGLAPPAGGKEKIARLLGLLGLVVGDRFLQHREFLAGKEAQVVERLQLLFCLGKVADHQVGLAQVLVRALVLRIQAQRLVVVLEHQFHFRIRAHAQRVGVQVVVIGIRGVLLDACARERACLRPIGFPDRRLDRLQSRVPALGAKIRIVAASRRPGRAGIGCDDGDGDRMEQEALHRNLQCAVEG